MTKPDVVIIVLDCVRADSFPCSSVQGFPSDFSRDLKAECVTFTRAASVASWSLPAHASLFTGQYPWEHRVHAKGVLELPGNVPTIAEHLAGAGYSTLCLSGNAFLSPDGGLVRGFGQVGYAEWWEHYLRSWPNQKRLVPGLSHSTTVTEKGAASIRPGVRRILTELAALFPVGVDLGNRVFRGLYDGQSSSLKPGTSPWIEPEFDSWIHSQPGAKPTFTFINFVDAHDPYLTDPNSPISPREWWRETSIHQQRAYYQLGRGVLSEEKRCVLRRLYSESTRRLETRLQSVVRSLKSAGRWENTLLFITSDHGQSFGDHSFLFHGVRADEGLLRIPLWVKFPNSRQGGSQTSSWASLIDIVPTITNVARLPTMRAVPGVPLHELVDRPRDQPVFAMGDGLADRSSAGRWLPQSVVDRLDHVTLAAYSDTRKIVLSDKSKPPSIYDVGTDPNETVNLWSTDKSKFQTIVEKMRNILSNVQDNISPRHPRDTLARLASWGYS